MLSILVIWLMTAIGMAQATQSHLHGEIDIPELVEEAHDMLEEYHLYAAFNDSLNTCRSHRLMTSQLHQLSGSFAIILAAFSRPSSHSEHRAEAQRCMFVLDGGHCPSRARGI